MFVATVQFFQTKFNSKNIPQQKNFSSEREKKIFEFSQMFQKQMNFFMPLFTFFVLSTLPSIIGLYWLTTNLFSFLEYFIVKRIYKKEASHIKN